MKNVLGAVIALDDAFLDGMRQVADPPADRVACHVPASPRDDRDSAIGRAGAGR